MAPGLRDLTRSEASAESSAIFNRRAVCHDRVSRSARQRPRGKHGSRSLAGICAGADTPELIAWWIRARPRLMFFGGGNAETKALNGKLYPHPALVFMIQGRELFVRALAENRRLGANTRIRNAPYWNTDSYGRVCLGSMRVPG